MNNSDTQKAILKVFGMILLLLATLSAARTVSALGSAWYWAATQSSLPATSGYTLGRQLMSTAIGHVLQALILGWLGVQALKEQPWVLRITRMNTSSRQITEQETGGDA